VPGISEGSIGGVIVIYKRHNEPHHPIGWNGC